MKNIKQYIFECVTGYHPKETSACLEGWRNMNPPDLIANIEAYAENESKMLSAKEVLEVYGACLEYKKANNENDLFYIWKSLDKEEVL